MIPGIFSTVFERATLDEVLGAMVEAGFRATQFHLASAVPVAEPRQNTIPAELDEATCRAIRETFAARGVTMAAVSGTFNLIHPDPGRRDEGFRRLELLASRCAALGTDVVTLCSGTLDAAYMWRTHPGNGSPAAWRSMLEGMARAAAIAERHGVRVAFEPEVSNVIDSAARARRAIDEVGSPHLKVCIDGANLYHRGELARLHEVLAEAFDLIGPEIVLAHAKDVTRDGEAGHDAAGTGLLDYDAYLGHLRDAGYEGAVVLHSLSEAQVPGCRDFLAARLASAARGGSRPA
ncbi:MAG: sugar phosphate isomerase/epimerase family protein [Gemmatimonadota bacterium]